MTWEIRQEDVVNVGYIDVNGRQACIAYDPNSSPLMPFESVTKLEEYLQEIHTQFEVLPVIASVGTIPAGRKEWHPHDFWLRFPQDKQIKILEAARTDPNVENFRMQLLMIGKVISDHPVTIAGMDYLVSNNLLTSEEKDNIMGIV